jgi:PhnB protein
MAKAATRTASKTASKPKSAPATAPAKTVKAKPDGMHTATPHLVIAGASEAIDFYKKAFGAEEMARLPGPDGKLMHGMIRIGDSPIMLVDEMPNWNILGPKALKGTPVTIHLYVDDVDAFADKAVGAGAKVAVPITDMFWGDRYGVLEDPFGHKWSVATHKQDLTPEQIRENMSKMDPSKGGC